MIYLVVFPQRFPMRYCKESDPLLMKRIDRLRTTDYLIYKFQSGRILTSTLW